MSSELRARCTDHAAAEASGALRAHLGNLTGSAERAVATASPARSVLANASTSRRSKTSTYAKYVGRVGALAVMLGVGGAIVAAPPVALADDSSGPSSSSSDSTGSESESSSSKNPNAATKSTSKQSADRPATKTAKDESDSGASDSATATSVSDGKPDKRGEQTRAEGGRTTTDATETDDAAEGDDSVQTVNSDSDSVETDDEPNVADVETLEPADDGSAAADGDDHEPSPPDAADADGELTTDDEAPTDTPVTTTARPVKDSDSKHGDFQPVPTRGIVSSTSTPTLKSAERDADSGLAEKDAATLDERQPDQSSEGVVVPLSHVTLAEDLGESAPIPKAFGSTPGQTLESTTVQQKVVTQTITKVVTDLLTAALSPFLASQDPAGTTPESPILLAVLGWARRQLSEALPEISQVVAQVAAAKVEPVQPVVAAAAPAAVPAEFERTELISGLDKPTDFEVLPDGRILVTEKDGTVMVYHDGHLHEEPMLTVPTKTDNERGLVGIEVDPNFSSNGYIYISYTTAANRDRLSRFKVVGDVANPASEYVLMESDQPANNIHHGGEIEFGPDGKLYWAVGDNTYGPNSQDLSNIHGKILRLNADGSAPADNPFVNTPGAVPQIYAYGFRNPFRFTFTPDGKMLVGDVGQATWEELNLVTPGGNYGWPQAEGTCTGCSYINPIYVYKHTDPPASAGAITSVMVYNGSAFGDANNKTVFIADYALGWIKELTFDPNYSSLISERMFDTQAGSTVKMAQAPDGGIYQLTIADGKLWRIDPATGNRAPTAVITATPNYGQAPLAVNFSSQGSSDPEGAPLTYAWNFGDGTTSTAANPSKTFNTKGAYNVTLTVSDGARTSQATQKITVGSTPPTVNIITPVNNSLYSAGDIISFRATATDAEDGTLPDSAYKWSVVFHHADHTHPFEDNIIGPSGTVTIPRSAENIDTTWYRVNLTVTDSSGLSTTKYVDVKPRLVNLTFNPNNPDATYTIDGIPRKGVYTERAVVGVERIIDAPSPQYVNGGQLVFNNWSDGQAQTHTIVTPATNTTYNLTFDGPSGLVVTSPASVGVPSRTNGVVTGIVNVVQRDGDPMTYTVVKAPTNGTASVNSSTGAWVYTPTYQARHNAVALNATAEQQVDRFTIKVSDADGGQVSIPVTVSLVSKEVPTTGEVKVGNGPSAVAFVPSGTRAYVTNYDSNTLTLINTTTNAVRHIVVGTGPTAIAISPDATRVYVANQKSNTVSVVNNNTNAVSSTINVGNAPSGLATTADGTRVYVTNSGSNTVSLIDTATNTVTKTINVGQSPTAIAIKGTRAYVTNSVSNTVSVIDTTNGTVTNTINLGAGNGPSAVAVSPDSTRIYVTNGTSNTVSVIDKATNTVIGKIAVGANPRSVGVSPDGKYLYVAALGTSTQGGTLSVIEAATNTTVAVLPTAKARAVAVAPNGTYAYVLKRDNGAVSIVGTTLSIDRDAANVAPATAVGQVGSSTPTTGVATYQVSGTDDDGDELISSSSQAAHGTVTNNGGGRFTYTPDLAYFQSTGAGTTDTFTVTTSDNHGGVSTKTVTYTWQSASPPSLPVTKTINVGAHPIGVTFNPIGTRAYVSNMNSDTVTVIDASTGAPMTTITVGDGPNGVATNPDSTRVYVVNYHSGTVSVINATTNAVIGTVNVGRRPWNAVVSPGGSQLYVTNSDSHNVSVIDTATNTVVKNIVVGRQPNGIAVNGNRVYVTNKLDNTVSVIDATTNTVTKTIGVGVAPVSVASQGNRAYVANSGSSTISVIDTSTNTVVDSLAVTALPKSVTLSPDGRYLYVTSIVSATQPAGLVAVVDTTTKATVAVVPDSKNAWAAAIAPSGTYAYIANRDTGTISVVDAVQSTA